MAGAKRKVFANTSYKDNGHVFGKITAYDEAGNSCNINTSKYYVDKDAPVITNKSIASRNSSYNSKDVVIKLALTDRVDTTNNRIYYSLSNDNKNYTSWYNYTLGQTSSINWTLSGDYDGKARTIYIKTKDDLGNSKVYTYNTNYKVYKECSERTGQTTTGSCSTNYGFGTATSTTTYKDIYLGSSCGTETSQTSCCINPKVEYGSFGSCSALCGGGTQSRSKTTYGCNGLVTYDTDTQSCNTQACRCERVYYSSGSCDASCGSYGSAYQYAYDYYDDLRCYDRNYYASCYGGSCYSPSTSYSDWSSCNVSCGYGTQTRTATTYWCDGTNSSSTESQSCYAGDCYTPPPQPEPDPTPSTPSKPLSCPKITSSTGKKTWVKGPVNFSIKNFSSNTYKWVWYTGSLNLSTNEYEWKEWPSNTYYSHANNNSMSVEGSGRRVVAVKVYDENGKSKFCTGGGEWWVDRTKPKVTITDHKNYKGPKCIDRPNYTYNHRYEVHMSDEHSGIYSTVCEWEQGPTKRSGWRPSVGENLCQTKTGGVKCKACDGVGNCQTASE